MTELLHWQWLTTALLLCPQPTPQGEFSSPAAIASLRIAATTLELSGPSEGWFDLIRLCDHRDEYVYEEREWNYGRALYEMRSALIDHGECPTLADLRYLPPAEVCHAWLKLNTNCRKHLSEGRAIAPPLLWEAFDEVLTDCAWRGRMTQLLTRAHYAPAWIDRRRALRDLREWVGAEAYYRAQWPQPIPAFRKSDD